MMAERFTLLIADDDDAWRETMRDVLEPAGYCVHTAANGREAVEAIGSLSIHCLLLDMHMPEMTGLEAVQTLRRSRILVPSILITADPNDRVLREAFVLQVFRVLQKPVTRDDLRVTVRQALAAAYGLPPDAMSNPSADPVAG